MWSDKRTAIEVNHSQTMKMNFMDENLMLAKSQDEKKDLQVRGAIR